MPPVDFYCPLKIMQSQNMTARPLFLATTADPSFWAAEGEMVFLGEWCKPPATRSCWGHRSYEMIPYHWANPERKYADYLYLAALHARILDVLSARLNRVHHANHSVRFWTIVVGPWLRTFVESLFDRYSSICEAKKRYPQLHTVLPKEETNRWIPKDFLQFLKWLPRDDYNLHLFAEILRGDHSIEVAFREIHCPVDTPAKPRPSLVSLAKGTLTWLTAMVPDAFNQVVIANSSFYVLDQFRLQLALGQLPYFKEVPHWARAGYIDVAERDQRLELETQNDFEVLVCRLIMRFIPDAYLESLSVLTERAEKELPKVAAQILSAVGWSSDEVFKVWAASQAERGAKLVAIQHGGVYGTTRYMSFEDHERGLSDRFVSWGWRDRRDEKVAPLSAPKLLKAKRQLIPKADGDIVWALVAMPRYFRRMHSAIDGSFMPDYLAEQVRFWEALAEETRRLVSLRLYTQDYGWGIREHMAAMAPSLKIEGWSKPFYARMREARLCVSTYNSTTYLETLAADFPTLIFWNPNYNQLREDAIPYFEQLQSCGVLHYTPESAASKLNQIHTDPQSWWRQPDIQEARRAFCERYAKTSPGWLEEWRAFCRG